MTQWTSRWSSGGVFTLKLRSCGFKSYQCLPDRFLTLELKPQRFPISAGSAAHRPPSGWLKCDHTPRRVILLCDSVLWLLLPHSLLMRMLAHLRCHCYVVGGQTEKTGASTDTSRQKEGRTPVFLPIPACMDSWFPQSLPALLVFDKLSKTPCMINDA